MTDGYTDGYLWQFNTAVYPPASVIEPIVSQLDPVIFTLGNYITAIIQNYLGPSFSQEWARVMNPNSSLNPSQGPVGDIVFNPLNAQLLETTDYQFPLLSLYREKEQYDQKVLFYIDTVSSFVLHYVLPPMNQEQLNVFQPFLPYLSKTFLKFFWQGADPLYQSYQNQFEEAGISQYWLRGAQYPQIVAQNAEGRTQFYPNIQIRFDIMEQERIPVPQNYLPITQVYIQSNVINDGYGPQDGYNNIADGYVNAFVNIVSFNPTSGPPNTWITMKGYGFLQVAPNSIQIAGIPVVSQVIRSDNVITILSGPSLQNISGPITVQDNLGNTYTSSSNFTYT